MSGERVAGHIRYMCGEEFWKVQMVLAGEKGKSWVHSIFSNFPCLPRVLLFLFRPFLSLDSDMTSFLILIWFF